MKNSKKLATLAILLALVGCGGGNENSKPNGGNSANTSNSSNGSNASSSSSSSQNSEDLEFLTAASKKLLAYNAYATEGVRGDFDLTTSLEDGLVAVTYTSSNADFLTIDGAVAKVTLPESGTTETGYVIVKLTATFSYNGLTIEKDFNIKIHEAAPATTIADIHASSTAETYAINGSVTAINARGFTVYDGTGTILVYLNKTPEVAVGDYVSVSGEISFYQGIAQFTSAATVSVLSKTAPEEVVYDFSNPTPYGLTELQAWADAGAKVGPYVTIRGTLNVSGSYYNVTIEGDDYIVGSLSYPAADLGADALDGKVIEATGFLLYKSGSSHIYANLIVTEIKEAELNEAEKAAAVKETLTLPADVTDTLSLPATGAYDSTITWTSANTAAIAIDAETGVVTVTQSSIDTEVTLTATITVGETTVTKDIVVVVKSSDPYAPTLITAPQVDTEYKLMMHQGNTNQDLYFDGGVSGNYLTTTTNRSEATSIVLVAVEGGYNIKVLVGEETKYLNVAVSGKYVNGKVEDTATTLWTYNEEYKTLVTKQTTEEGESDFYLGTYNSYTTISLSKLSYASTSFVSHLYTVPALPEYEVYPEAGVAYNLRLTQENNDNAILYFTGAEDGYYLGSTEDSSEAAVIELVEVEGGYNVKVIVNGTTKYLNAVVSGTHVNPKVEDEATSVWKFNSTYSTLVTDCEVEGVTKTYYIGTYRTFTTFSLSTIDKAATSFVSHLFADIVEPENRFANEGTLFGEEGLTHEDANAGKNILYWNDQGWCNSNVTVTATLEEGVYTYAITSDTGACAWGFQLFASVDGMVQGNEYTTTFVLNSTVAGKIRVNGEVKDIVVGDNKITTTKVYNGTLGEGSSAVAIIFGIDGDTANNTIVQNATYTVSKFKITGEVAAPETVDLATFTFGSNATAGTHVDGEAVANGTQYTDGEYTLTLNNITAVYGGGNDSQGNSCLKIGKSKGAGSFEFTVGDDVDYVVINVAGYKANAGEIVVNGTTYEIATVSNDGEYTAVVIDTTKTKTVTVSTETVYRAMIDSIVFQGTK